MKPDEIKFLTQFYNEMMLSRKNNTRVTPREIINRKDFYMHHKRAWYLLSKWGSKGWYEYGITEDSGWLTPEGIKYVESMTSQNATPSFN